MPTTQLDILALEPFYGGVRKIMLESVTRCSRHRWTLLKLPPRRIERRLSTASVWFSELLSRHFSGSIDLLFTSEALNLADLHRMHPELIRKPSVVYFHSNQLPDGTSKPGPLDLVNLNTAMAATEIWFNSYYHQEVFLARALSVVKRHPEISGQNPLADLAAKARVMPPPIATQQLESLMENESIRRNKRNVFVETRDADMAMLQQALSMCQRRGESFHLFTVGPVDGLPAEIQRTALSETDEMAQFRALLSCGIFLSAKPGAAFDHLAVRALTAGCWPLCPIDGVYAEMLPESMHAACLYDQSPSTLAGRMQDVWHLSHETGYEFALNENLQRYNPITACRAIDERLAELIVAHSITGGRGY